MAKIEFMTPDQMAEVITPELLRESCQQIRRELLTMPFQVFQDQTAKYVTVLPGVRNQVMFNELAGDAELAPYSTQNHDKADYTIVGRILEVFPGNCAKDFDPMPLFHSIYGESIALGQALTKHQIARKLLVYFAAKIGKHINDVVFVGGVRNVNGKTTADLFDSFDTIIAKEILAGNIVAAKNNFINLGTIDKTNATEILKEYYRSCDPELKKQNTFMYMSPEIYDDYVDDYQARHGALAYNNSFEKDTLEGSRGKCKFAVLDNMAGSNFLKISTKPNFLLGTDIMNQQNHANVGKYGPWNCTFEYAGVYGEQIRCINKELLKVAAFELGDGSGSTDNGGDDEPETIVVKSPVTVSFAKAVDNATMGTEYAGQVATTDPAGKTVTYESSDETVATVNETTGAVTLVGAGTTLIKASFAGDDSHYAASGSYALTVAAQE